MEHGIELFINELHRHKLIHAFLYVPYLTLEHNPYIFFSHFYQFNYYQQVGKALNLNKDLFFVQGCIFILLSISSRSPNLAGS